MSAVLLAGCSSAGSSASGSAIAQADAPPGIRLVLEHRPAPLTEAIQVFVCAVPFPTSDPLYGDLQLRLDLDPTTIAAQMQRHVSLYYRALSNGAYRPDFVAGETLTMTTEETHDQCVEDAVDASSPEAAAVLVVANAENLATGPGGWGRPGTPCAATFCSAASTRRAVYVGASDFHPDNGAVPLLDLIEHEIGHTLDLPHSGDTSARYDSVLDVMSNSAAPRDVQPERKNAQDTIAVNRVALGWIPDDDVAVAGPAGGTYMLSPSAGPAGRRVVFVPLGDLIFLTVEYLAGTGFDAFLPSGGIAVHRIDESPTVCEMPVAGACVGIDRQQLTVGSTPPHRDLLATAGASWTVDGWRITLVRAASGPMDTVQVEVVPTDG